MSKPLSPHWGSILSPDLLSDAFYPPLGDDLGGRVRVPDTSFLLEGEYHRFGDDLVIISPHGERFTLEHYFSVDHPPILTTANGRFLLPETVELLLEPDPSGTPWVMVAGPTVAGGGGTPDPIGHVNQMAGTVTAKSKLGVLRTLENGDPLFREDTIKTEAGGLVKLIFRDQTLFQLGEQATLILNKYVYGVDAEQGAFEATVLRGVFKYKSGDMAHLQAQKHTTLHTPSASIGIRGSELMGEVTADGQTTIIHTSGSLEISDAEGKGTVTLLEPGMATMVVLDGSPQPAFKASQDILDRLNSQLPAQIPGNPPTVPLEAEVPPEKSLMRAYGEMEALEEDGSEDSDEKADDTIVLARLSSTGGGGLSTEAGSEEGAEEASSSSKLQNASTDLLPPLLLDVEVDPGLFYGIFLDSPVEGVPYHTETLEGLTGPQGQFVYRAGETAVFSLGGISLGQAQMAFMKGHILFVTPKVLAANATDDPDAQSVIQSNLIRLLQTLDSDGDPSNGMFISAAARQGAAGVLDIDVTQSEEMFFKNTDLIAYLAGLQGVAVDDVVLVDHDQAWAHYNQTLTVVDTFENDIRTGVLTVAQVTDIFLTNANKAPLITSDASGRVDENAPVSTVVYTVVATDPDMSEELSYTLSGSDAAWFSLDVTSGAVTLNTPADFENKPNYSIEAHVTDHGGLIATQAVTISVNDLNEAPEMTSGTTGSVTENAPVSTVVYTATAVDQDTAEVLSYGLSGTDAGLFLIDATSGAVTLKSSADFESQSSYTMDVVAMDDDGLTIRQGVTIHVTDQEEPPGMTSGSTGRVDENALASTVVYTVTATHPNEGEVLRYGLGGMDAGFFSMDATSGAVVLNAPADYESQSSYALEVSATDSGGLTVRQPVTITVTDINEVPVITSVKTVEVAESGTPASVVYTVTATDPDTASVLSYSLSGIDEGLFSIDAASGAVSLNAAPDFESKSSYSVFVVATDQGGLTGRQAVTLFILDVHEIPVITSGTTGSVEENADVSTVVYTVTATDPDVDSELTYSLGGADAALFTMDAEGSVTLNAPADFESKAFYTVDVRATDQDGLVATQTVTLEVIDVEEITEPLLTEPLLLESSPADDASMVWGGNDIVLTFNKSVRVGTGNIMISDGTDTRTIDVGDTSQVTFLDATVTIHPQAPLKANSRYSVQLGSDVIMDTEGQAYAGLLEPTALHFTVISPSVVSLAQLGGNGFHLDGEGAGDQLGFSVRSAGDFNRDGFDDLILGAHQADPNGVENAGSSYVIFGQAAGIRSPVNLSSLDGNTGFRLDGVAEKDQLGFSVSGAGDINGDGFEDLIVAAHKANPNGLDDAGSSYVIFGQAAPDAVLDLAMLDGNTGFRLDGVAAGDLLGSSVRGAGDINGDGFADLIIGARGADPNGLYSGSSYVIFGKSSGYAATLNLATLGGKDGFRLDGLAAYENLGFSVSGAGDVNGDGFDDLVVGAIGTGGNGPFSGSSYVIFGKASAFEATFDLNTLDGNEGYRLDGVTEDDQLGVSVRGAGDINGDGLDDLILGAKQASPNGAQSGASYVVLGKALGYAATLDLSSLDGNTGFRLEGTAAGDLSGFSVDAAGDVNGDGFDDLIVGAQGADPDTLSAAGASYVIFGQSSVFASSLNLESLDGSTGFRLEGVMAGDQSGFSVSSGGDVNGDGFDDLIIGANTASNNLTTSGASYVVYGQDFTGKVSHQGSNGPDTLTGTSEDDILIGGLGNDTLQGDLGADVLKGGEGDDILFWDGADLKIDGGRGYDTLKLVTTQATLDLTALANSRMLNLESIDLTETGDHVLTLDMRDLLDFSGTDHQILVKGDAGDVVNAQTEVDWILNTGGTVFVDDVRYDTDASGQAILGLESYTVYNSASGFNALLVDTDIAFNFIP